MPAELRQGIEQHSSKISHQHQWDCIEPAELAEAETMLEGCRFHQAWATDVLCCTTPLIWQSPKWGETVLQVLRTPLYI